MRLQVESILSSVFDSNMVKQLLDAYSELKENYYLGRYRPAELEGGRFSEAAIRCMQQLGNGSYVPFSKNLKRFDQEVKNLESAGGGSAHDSIRIHVPRLLFGIYGIRNRRNVGHVGGDVNPDFADSTLVMTICDWVLAEIIRLNYNCSLEDAQALVDGLVARKIPLVQDFDGHLKVLDPGLSAPDQILSVLYTKGNVGASQEELITWLRPTTKKNVVLSLGRLESQRRFIHRSNGNCYITQTGIRHYEDNISPVV